MFGQSRSFVVQALVNFPAKLKHDSDSFLFLFFRIFYYRYNIKQIFIMNF